MSPAELADVLGPAGAGLARLLPELAPGTAVRPEAGPAGADLHKGQLSLPAEVFGRAYGLALPASIGGIVAGSLVAPLLVSALGGTGAMVATGGAVVAYGLLLLRGAGTAGPVPADAAAPAADLAEDLPVAAEA